MPRLDNLIEKLLSHPGSQLVFETGAGALLKSASSSLRLIQQALTTQQIVGAFAEIVPSDLQRGFPRAGATAFAYRAPAGAVDVRFQASDGRVSAVVVPKEEASSPLFYEPATPPSPPARTASALGFASTEGFASTGAATPAVAGDSRAVAIPPSPPARTGSALGVASTGGVAPKGAAAPARTRTAPLPDDPREAMDALLALLPERRASDLHLASENAPALRVDGDVARLDEYGPLSARRLSDLLWSIAPARNREEWERCHDTDFGYETPVGRFRANIFADRTGIGAVFRLIPNEIMTAEEMGLPSAVLELCHLTKGLVLVTGPTGSGKSTTLAALIDYVNRNREDHIITIEDPIEFVHKNKRCIVNQREVGTHTESFKRALRAALREDPDVVLVGELRDLETIAIAIETAETGHLVFGTLHTNTAPSTVDRIIDQFPHERQEQIRTMMSESLKGVISQTLCKRVGGGRAAAQEVLLCIPSVANLIREGKTFQIPSIMQTGRGHGMVTLNDALVDLVKRQLVEPAEAHKKAAAKAELKGLLERAGFSLA
jgi:twitching motility protein PilT